MEEKDIETGIQFPVPDEELKGRKVVIIGHVGVGKSGTLASIVESLREKGCEVVRVEDMKDVVVTDPIEGLTQKMLDVVDEVTKYKDDYEPPKRSYTKPSYHRKNFWE